MFELGQVFITKGAQELLDSAGESATHYIKRHHSGDYGDVPWTEKEVNARAIVKGWKIMSSYQLKDGVIWVCTEGDRSATTVLRPEEY